MESIECLLCSLICRCGSLRANMMNLGQLSFIGSASKLGQELDGDQVLHAPSPVPYFSQVWLTYLIFEALGF